MYQEDEFADTINIEGVLTGEQWLTSNFLAGTHEATAQSATITRRITDLKEDRLNRSDISKRPISPFIGAGPNGANLGYNDPNNPFTLSRNGCALANPANLDRSLHSAMKTRERIPRTPMGASDPNWKDKFKPESPFDFEQYFIKNNQ